MKTTMTRFLDWLHDLIVVRWWWMDIAFAVMVTGYAACLVTVRPQHSDTLWLICVGWWLRLGLTDAAKCIAKRRNEQARRLADRQARAR